MTRRRTTSLSNFDQNLVRLPHQVPGVLVSWILQLSSSSYAEEEDTCSSAPRPRSVRTCKCHPPHMTRWTLALPYTDADPLWRHRRSRRELRISKRSTKTTTDLYSEQTMVRNPTTNYLSTLCSQLRLHPDTRQGTIIKSNTEPSDPTVGTPHLRPKKLAQGAWCPSQPSQLQLHTSADFST